MNKTISKTQYALIFGIPLLIIGIMVAIVKSEVFQAHSSTMAIGITFDLLLTMPLIYVLLIRKTAIPKTTIVPLLILGLVVGFNILPEAHHTHLNMFKTWALPVIEISVIGYVIYNIRKTLKRFKAEKKNATDFYTALQTVCKERLPKLPAKLLANEIAICYYGLWYWKPIELASNEFSYHKNSGTLAVLGASIFIIGIETFVLHVLVEKWSVITAWVLTGLSIYSAFQILGFLKALMKRPISIENNILCLRYGILSESHIPIDTIETVEISSKDIDKDHVKKLSPLGDLETHNLIITLNKEAVLQGLFGSEKPFSALALYVDDKEHFKSCLEECIGSKS